MDNAAALHQDIEEWLVEWGITTEGLVVDRKVARYSHGYEDTVCVWLSDFGYVVLSVPTAQAWDAFVAWATANLLSTDATNAPA